MKTFINFFFILFFISSSCQNVNYDTIDFKGNDVVILSASYTQNYISNIELVIKLDDRAANVQNTNDFRDLYLAFGYINENKEYETKGQQFFRPTENKTVSRDNIKLNEIKYNYEQFLYINMDITSLELNHIDGFYIYFHLSDMDREPILRYNTEAFFYRSEKAKQLKLYEDTPGFKSAYKKN